LVTKQWD